jgi:hemerythrin-like domain-containing protein
MYEKPKLDKFAQLLETEHLLGNRIFAIGDALAARLAPILDEQISSTQFRKLKTGAIPTEVWRAGSYFVHLINHFADPVHMRAEEAAVDFAVGCGLPRDEADWVFAQHEQARAYWNAITIAWKRMAGHDDGDRYYAAMDFRRSTEAFVFLFEAHAIRENTDLYERASAVVDAKSDALILSMLQHAAEPDFLNPYIGMVTHAEDLLGITPPAGSPIVR